MDDLDEMGRIAVQLAQIEDENADTIGAPEPEQYVIPITGSEQMLACDWCGELWPLPLLNWNPSMTEKICMACAVDAGECDY